MHYLNWPVLGDKIASAMNAASNATDMLFERCVQAARTPAGDEPPVIRPTDEQRLSLYAAYKQATSGDCKRPAPWMWQLVERRKWDAWTGFRGISKGDAKRSYIVLIRDLLR